MYFDPMYFLFIIPPFLLSLFASFRTKSAFNRYSKVRVSTGLTGAQAAAEMLRRAGLTNVEIVPTRGFLSDHYNPVTHTLALSEAVYATPSVAAVGVACHEAGHAIQHATGYKALGLRSVLVPTAGIGSNIGYFMMLIGLFLSSSGMVAVGAMLFSAVVLFQLVTLPVEFNASARAKRLVLEYGIVGPGEERGVARVLNAAALTYVAAAASSIMTLLYFLLRSGLLGGSRD
jgi:Zn-dependent membrane protease YugP